MEKRKTYSEIVLELELDGRHEEAEAIAKRVIEWYREDPTGNGCKHTADSEIDDSQCCDCGYVFTEADCRFGEIEPHILCERCYVARGGR